LEYPEDGDSRRAIAIAEMLDGLPLSQALHIVTEQVPSLLTSTHTVQVSNDRFQQLKA
jgi:pyridoxal/pyridoxine/pyridoxamine kinase